MEWWILGWFICGVVQYLLRRAKVRHKFGEWDRGDRAFSLLISLAGPFAIWCLIAADIATGKWWKNCNKPAKW